MQILAYLLIALGIVGLVYYQKYKSTASHARAILLWSLHLLAFGIAIELIYLFFPDSR